MTNLLETPGGETGSREPVYVPVLVNQNRQTILSAALQEIFHAEQQLLGRQRLITRCDNLPVVFMEQTEVKSICSKLVRMILQQPPRKGKLFIYVRSDRLQDAFPGELPHKFEILFHTNCYNKPSWELDYREQLDQCSAICAANDGAFSYQDNSEGNYLFRLILPGKLQEHATG